MKTDLTQKFSQPYISTEERSKTVSVLEQKIKQFESEPGNRDGRGVRRAVRRQVTRTTGQLKNAFRHHKNHPDSAIRHEAGKLIKKIFHLEFEELAVEASAFRGKLSKSTQRHKEKRRQEGARIIQISNSLALKEVRSLVELMSVGKTLQNCVGRRFHADRYMDSVERSESELWILLRDEQVCGLMEIEVDRSKELRIIEACSTFENESAELSHDEAMEILRKLQITNAEDESFARVGAYPLFLHINMGDSIPNPIKVSRWWHYLWKTKTKIIVATADRPPHAKGKFLPQELSWSEFSEYENEYRGPISNALSEGELLKIVLHSREFREALDKTPPTNRIGQEASLDESEPYRKTDLVPILRG